MSKVENKINLIKDVLVMKNTFALIAIFVLLIMLAGCGAGIIHQTTQKDFQTITYTDAKIKAKKTFFKGSSPSVRFIATGKAVKFTEEGFQVGTGRQAFCEYEVVGDPYVKDWGAAALDQYSVQLDGCDAQAWFKQKESALMFAQLLYTLKHQAEENKVARNVSSGNAVSAESKTRTSETDMEKIVALSNRSDVDELPPMKAKPNKNAYAIVIGIEQYRQKLPKADFAAQDAKTVAEYLTKAMGYPEENIVILTNGNAAKSDFEKYFEQWLANHAEKGSTVFVYYSGHGAPNPKSGDAYLVPYDGDPSFIAQTGYSLKRLYESLGKLPAKEIIVALDSCFSGAGGRSVLPKGARPLVMNLQANTVLARNMTVMSASSGEQISSTYDEKGHGLFTYFLLKGIKNEDVVRQDGSIAVSDLFSYIKPQVERIARRQYNNEQTPQLIGHKPSLKQ
jgi:hypothetical protein